MQKFYDDVANRFGDEKVLFYQDYMLEDYSDKAYKLHVHPNTVHRYPDLHLKRGTTYIPKSQCHVDHEARMIAFPKWCLKQ